MTVENTEDKKNVLNISDDITPGSSSKERSTEPQPPFALLSVPPNKLSRRSSADSAFSGSDISELSFGSTELGSTHEEGLLRTLSNVSSTLVSIPPPSKWRLRLQELWVANYGAFLVLISQMFGCMMNIATRLLETPGPHGAPMHPFQILFARQFITVLITSTYAIWSKSVPHFPLGPPGKVRWLLVARGVCGFFGVVGIYFSLVYLPINEATILTFLAPIGAGYTFSLLIAGETFSRQQQLAALTSLIGVIFIARPASLFSSGSTSPDLGPPDMEVSPPGNGTYSAQEPDIPHPTSAQHLQAVGIAMIGVLGSIGALTAIRAIGTRAHALISVNYFSFWCTFVSLVALIAIPEVKFRLPGNVTEWGLLSLLGCCGFTMQLLLTKGMAYGSSSGANKTGSQGVTADLEMQDRGDISTQRHGMTTTTTRRGPIAIPGTDQAPNHNKQIKGSGAKATSMLYTQMLFALIADKMIFGVTPGLWSWIGSGFILFGAIWVAADRGKKPTTNPIVLSEERSVTPQKSANAAHEEEVGLLADMDDTDTPHAGQESGGPTSSGTRQTSSSNT